MHFLTAGIGSRPASRSQLLASSGFMVADRFVFHHPAGACAGTAAVLTSMPADCVKTQIELAAVAAPGGLLPDLAMFFATARSMVRSGGPGALFRGMGPRLADKVPGTMVRTPPAGLRRVVRSLVDIGWCLSLVGVALSGYPWISLARVDAVKEEERKFAILTAQVYWLAVESCRRVLVPYIQLPVDEEEEFASGRGMHEAASPAPLAA